MIQLLLYPNGASSVVNDVEGDPVTQLMWLGLYMITLILVLARWKWFIYVATRDKALLLLYGVVIVSVLWSGAPEVTLRRIIALGGTTMIGAYLASRYTLREVLRLTAWALGIAALLSLVFALALPSYGRDLADPNGAWQGIFSGGKNILGRQMSLSALIFLLLAFSAQRYRWVVWAGFGLSVSLLLLSNSITSLLSLAAIMVFLVAYAALRWPYTLAIPCLMLALLVCVTTGLWLEGHAQSLLSDLGRDATLTGRTKLWPAVLEMIWQRPWLGYGYGAFWLGWDGESAQIWHWTSVPAVHAHNGFLEIWLELGLLGLAAFALQFLLAARRALTLVRLPDAAEGLFPLTFLTFMLLCNLTEVSLLIRNDLYWILYVTATISTAVRLSGVPYDAVHPSMPQTRGPLREPLHAARRADGMRRGPPTSQTTPEAIRRRGDVR